MPLTATVAVTPCGTATVAVAPCGTATVAVAPCDTATGLQSESPVPAETIQFPLLETPAVALWSTQLAAQWIPLLLLWQQGGRSVMLSTQLYAAP